MRQSPKDSLRSEFGLVCSIICLLPLLLTGCSTDRFRLFHPIGPVAAYEWGITLLDMGIMALIVVPITLLFIFFLWRYRHSRNAAYDPHRSNSRPLEIGMWVLPFVIVSALAYVSFRSAYMVNPYDPDVLNGRPPNAMPGIQANALHVDVISTDWQWIFIYPQQDIATIDDLVVPEGREVDLRLTSTSVVNDFFVPQVAPMIDVMPGMRTKDDFEVTQLSDVIGFSDNFSGPGFSWMRFHLHTVTPDRFKTWVAAMQHAPNHLNYAAFQILAQPKINPDATPAYFSHVEPGLFVRVYNDAKLGKVYPVPNYLTRAMQRNLHLYATSGYALLNATMRQSAAKHGISTNAPGKPGGK